LKEVASSDAFCKIEDRLDLEGVTMHARATPEKALLDWLYLAKSPRSTLSPPGLHDVDHEVLNKRRLMRPAHAMTYALPEDMRLIRRYVSDDDFREALDDAPPGIIDPRSWAYWNSNKMGRYPPPPAPVRRFAAA
jgi:hypothetical protein